MSKPAETSLTGDELRALRARVEALKTRRPGKLSPAQRDQLLRDFAAGSTLQQLSARYGIRLSSVRHHIKRAARVEP